jgi:CBS domain-containing protein
MLVKDVMTRGVECARPTDSVVAAAAKMRDLDIGTLPVCGDHQHLVGIVTDRDITIRTVAESRDPKLTEVGDVMTPNVLYCFDDQDITEAAELMQKNQVRRLVVLNRDKWLVGIVSLGDLAVDAHDERLTGNVLEAVSEPGSRHH